MNADIKKPLEIPSDNNIEESLLFHTSANFLCNFMRKIEFLKMAIRDMAIKPRYFEEKIEYLGIPEWTSICFPMTCFCDIPLTKVSYHMQEYGDYGIALNKNYCISKDVQPISYLNNNSRLKKDLSEVLAKLYASPPLSEKLRIYPNMILGQLLYTKPIDGYMQRGDDQPKHLLFKDECEWRYIPEIPEDMPLIMSPIDNTSEGRNKYSEALATYKSTWFRFDTDNIEYIVVPDEKEALQMITYINKLKNRTMNDKQKLISKIEISQKIQNNFI